MAGKRYYYSEDDFNGVTPGRLKRLSRARQKEYMRYWFHRNFEDPVNETPYNSKEGGYLYIWGGPYDAGDELYNEFGSLVSEQRIEKVINEVEADGISDWAPGPDHPDHQEAHREWEADRPQNEDLPVEPLDHIISQLEADVKPRYGDTIELELRRELIDRLSQLTQAMVPPHGGIGHNNPPPDDENSSVIVIDEVRDATTVISNELATPEPDALRVANATSRLKTALRWFGKKLDVAADSFAKEVGGMAGKVAVAAAVVYVYPPLGELIADIVSRLVQWLGYVTSIF
jgi:hypothetical protein